MNEQARLQAALSLSQHGQQTIQDVKNVLGPLEGAQETSEKLDHTLQAYGRLERRSAEKSRRIRALEDALQVAYNHCADWSNDDMRDHCWAALKASRKPTERTERDD